MKFKWDTKELTEFAERLVDTHELETAMMTATQDIARVLHKALLQNTPVVTGNLRKNWSSGENLAFRVEKKNNGYEVTLINTARTGSEHGFMYAVAVNYGNRKGNGGWGMGRFFVATSIIQTAESSQIERIIFNQLQKWWKEG